MLIQWDSSLSIVYVLVLHIEAKERPTLLMPTRGVYSSVSCKSDDTHTNGQQCGIFFYFKDHAQRPRFLIMALKEVCSGHLVLFTHLKDIMVAQENWWRIGTTSFSMMVYSTEEAFASLLDHCVKNIRKAKTKD